MAIPYAAYTASAGQRDFTVTFPFINRSHVTIHVNGVPVSPLSWPSSTQVRLPQALTGGDFVELSRSTPIETQLVKFQDGNVLTAEDLNTAVQQALYRQQELSAQYTRSVEAATTRIAENGGTAIPVEDLLNTIAAQVAESQVIAEFQQRLADIDSNAVNILTQAQDLADRTTEIEALSGTSDALTSTQATLQGQADGLRTDLETLTGVVDSLAGGDAGSGIATLIQNEENARIQGDQALVDTISLLGAKSGDSLSFIADLNTLKVSPTESLAQRFSALSASDANNAAAIVAETAARVTEIAAEASRIDLLTSRMTSTEDATTTNAADIVAEQSARAAGDSAEASQRALLEARVTSTEDATATNAAAIVTEQAARASGDAAEASQRALLEARVGDAEGDVAANAAAIVTEQAARADGDQALATDLSLLGAVNTGGTAFILNEDTVQVLAGETLGTRLEAINTSLDTNAANIASEETARISGDAAEASARSALEARVTAAEGDVAANAAAVVTESNARASAIAAEAAERTALAARVTQTEGGVAANAASIETESNARATEIAAEASERTALAARVAQAESDVVANAAAIVTESDARATDIAAEAAERTVLAARVTQTESDVDTVAASVVSEQSARATADGALSSSITAVQTTVDGNSAAVSVLQSSVNGLEARYGVVLDVNGYITGFSQNNDGQSGTFQILADKFQIVDPAGGAQATPFVPFEVSGGSVRIKNAVIDNLSVERLADGDMSANITQNGDLTMGTGRIVFDNGTYMKVAGVGFGTNSQFIEWFGPKVAIDQCSEANGIQYLKTNGDAYFGGALSAGVLKNAVQTTQTASNASASTGTFGSNGGTRSVVVSFNSYRSVSISGACDGSGNPSVQVRLSRNGTVLQTWTLNGSTSCSPGFGVNEQGLWEENISGSWTVTDTTGGTSAEYTVELVSRTLASSPSSTVGSMEHTQSLGVISTEE